MNWDPARDLVDDALRESGWDRTVFLDAKGGAGYALYWSLTKRIAPLLQPWYVRAWRDVRDVWEGEK